MATFRGTVYSKILGMDTNLNIVAPRCKSGNNAGLPRVVYLLHGLSDNADAWLENANLRELSTENNVVFVMPEVQRGFYSNMAFGLDYFDYIADELPEILKNIFNVSDKPEDTYVCGLSMGGYGVIKLILSNPDKYAACGAFSTVCSPQKSLKLDGIEFSEKEKISVFGNDDGSLELTGLIDEFVKSSRKPSVYMTCGNKDFLHDINKEFIELLSEKEIPVVYEEWDGTHNWKFWRESLEKAMSFFFGGK